VHDVAVALLEVLESGERGALATVVRVSGSTPRTPGARLLLKPDKTLVGTVGGGAIEQAVVLALHHAVATGETAFVAKDLGRDLGMCCGGRMEVFVEPIEGRPRLWIFGAGHVAKPTAALARTVGFDVIVADARTEQATEARFPGCRLEVGDPLALLSRTLLGERDWLLIVTHEHRLDGALLELACRKSARYIGLVGSKRKVFRLAGNVRESQGEAALDRVYAPVGLDIGAETPEEIAVSVVSELVLLRRGGHGVHLRAVEAMRLKKVAGDAEDGAPKRRLSLLPSCDAGPSAFDRGPARIVAQSGGEAPPREASTPVSSVASDATTTPLVAPARRSLAPGLGEHARRVHQDLDLLDYPRREWLPPRKTSGGAHVYDVIIVGAGQGGLAAAFGLQRERVKNILVVDQNPLDRAGPWLNFARMRTLRTPKYLTGPDLGVPSLTPRAWYEAEHGEGSWETLGLVPKELWAAYLAWYRRTLDIPVRPDTRVGALRWIEAEKAWEVPCSSNGQGDTLYARRVVLATGIDGSGQWTVPRMIESALPKHLYAHTRADIDFAALKGKRIAVLGAGASAFDNASTALEAGAAEVGLYFRRKDLVNVNAYRWAEFVGFLKHLGDLQDADKWRFISQILKMGQLPPTDTFKRATAHAGFSMHPGSGWKAVEARGDTVLITTESGTSEFDFVIVATGFVTDLSTRPELTHVHADVATWADRHLPTEDKSDDLLRHPYLGPHFEFTERTPGASPHVGYLYNYTFGCLLSLGFGGASISGMKYSIPRLVSGITGSFFVEDQRAHFETLLHFAEREF
jgi:xanthine/CO dehydrogenase XdhC/CoxF family maturation factor/cation diffusion facilitator CzcD-associated flavoprotein CzcO